MSSHCLWALLVVAVAFGTPAVNAVCTEACWESCFQKFGTEAYRYRDVWDNVLEAALEINYLKNIYNITKIGFLLDSSISRRHNIAEKSATEKLENGKDIFAFEVLLAVIITFIVNGPQFFIVQYNEKSAWTCHELGCIADSCATFGAVNKLSQIEMLPTSHCRGNIEAGCSLLHQQMTDNNCGGPTNQRSMVVAITNGNFYLGHDDGDDSRSHKCPKVHRSSSSSEEDLFSPCHAYFDTRYVIGTHKSRREDMNRFPSKHGNFRFIKDDSFSLDGLSTLVQCFDGSVNGAATNLLPNCCTSIPTPNITACYITSGSFGEFTNNYPTHPALNSNYTINFNT